MTVAVLAGGPSSEREVSLWTAKTITDALYRLKIPHQLIDPRSPNWLEHLTAIQPAVVVIALHGTFGEDGQIQTILEENRLAFTGSDSVCAAAAFNKQQAKTTAAELEIATPQWQIVTNPEPCRIPPPVVVKPNQEGSSYGITIAWKLHEIEPAVAVAKEYGREVLIEEYIAGTEVTCAVLDVFGHVQALPLVEIRPETEFFDFQAKYDARYCHEICPAEIDSRLTQTVQEQSVAIFQKLGCRQYARIDWIIRDGIPYFLEINTLPGMTKTSLINKELAAPRVSILINLSPNLLQPLPK